MKSLITILLNAILLISTQRAVAAESAQQRLGGAAAAAEICRASFRQQHDAALESYRAHALTQAFLTKFETIRADQPGHSGPYMLSGQGFEENLDVLSRINLAIAELRNKLQTNNVSARARQLAQRLSQRLGRGTLNPAIFEPLPSLSRVTTLNTAVTREQRWLGTLRQEIGMNARAAQLTDVFSQLSPYANRETQLRTLLDQYSQTLRQLVQETETMRASQSMSYWDYIVMQSRQMYAFQVFRGRLLGSINRSGIMSPDRVHHYFSNFNSAETAYEEVSAENFTGSRMFQAIRNQQRMESYLIEGQDNEIAYRGRILRLLTGIRSQASLIPLFVAENNGLHGLFTQVVAQSMSVHMIGLNSGMSHIDGLSVRCYGLVCHDLRHIESVQAFAANLYPNSASIDQATASLAALTERVFLRVLEDKSWDETMRFTIFWTIISSEDGTMSLQELMTDSALNEFLRVHFFVGADAEELMQALASGRVSSNLQARQVSVLREYVHNPSTAARMMNYMGFGQELQAPTGSETSEAFARELIRRLQAIGRTSRDVVRDIVRPELSR